MGGEVIVEVEDTAVDEIPTTATNGIAVAGPNMDGETKTMMMDISILQPSSMTPSQRRMYFIGREQV